MAADPASVLKAALPFLVNPDHGLIKTVYEMPREARMPKVFYYKAVLGNPDPSLPVDHFPVSAGTALTRDRAMQKAIGEAIEQYGAGCLDEEKMILARKTHGLRITMYERT